MIAIAGEWAIKEQPAQAGPLGLFIIVALAVATLLLVRSMSKHLRRVPASFEPEEPPPAGDDPPADPPAGPHSSP
ncbi:MAG: hypothetical protein M3042_04625 [Actinomycetota bacterium]|nr:hypothetical protein [Actinomycetota bacterium]